MYNSLNLQIRTGIMDYLAEKVSLFQFLDWLMDREEDVEKAGDAELLHLVETIKLYWAELTGDYLTKEEFRDLLRPFIETLVVPLEIGELVQQQHIFSTSSKPEIVANKLLGSTDQPIREEEVINFSPSSWAYNRSLANDSQRYPSEQLVFQ
jgi:hypothetical protein